MIASVTSDAPRLSSDTVLEALARGNFDPHLLRAALHFEEEPQQQLFAQARRKRSEAFPSEEVEVRSVIEVSNVCRQRCNYCNMAQGSSRPRYTIQLEDFLRLAGYLYEKGRRVLLVQSGENGAQSFVDHVCRCLESAKQQHPDLELILCLGNYRPAQYRQLREAGAERYILKFETSNPDLYARLKPGDTLKRRLGCIRSLVELGFQVGSGNIVGLPGQTLDDLVKDLELLWQLSLAMVSCTVFIPGEDSQCRHEPIGDVNQALNMIALMRLMNPRCLIPSTSAFEKGRKGGQYWALMAGANTVTIHDGTPEELKELFPIYSTKRFAPDFDHLGKAVEESGLKPAPGALL